MRSTRRSGGLFGTGLVLALIAAGASTASAASLREASLREELGFATDLDSSRPLYREQHLLRRDGSGALLERLVVYRCTDGTPFARKRVDYRVEPRAPAFVLEDVRMGYREGVERGAAGSRMFVDLPDAEREQAALPEGPLVADSGFDQWVRGNWPALTRGERVPMAFLVPAQLASYDFKVYEVDAMTGDAASERRFRMRLGGVLGWIAPHIDVVYADADRRLLRFEGLSNLRGDSGRTQLEVRIEFKEPPRPAATADWARLAAEPLRACRVGA